MKDESKRLKFRKNGKVYAAAVVRLDQTQRLPVGLLYDRALFRIYDSDTEELVGVVLFKESMLLNFIWGSPSQPHLSGKYVDDALVNLLHYLPFYPDKLISLFEKGGMVYAYSFVRDHNEGEAKGSEYYIKTVDSFPKTFLRIMFGDSPQEQQIRNAILELLYVHRLDNPRTGILIEQLEYVIPVRKNQMESCLLYLRDDELIEVQFDASQNMVSAKITIKGVKLVEGTLSEEVKPMVKNVYGPSYESHTYGPSSPIVNITSGDITNVFNAVRQEVEKKGPERKNEILEELSELEKEVKKPTDLNKISKHVSKLRKLAGWVAGMVEGVVQNLMAQVIAGKIYLGE